MLAGSSPSTSPMIRQTMGIMCVTYKESSQVHETHLFNKMKNVHLIPYRLVNIVYLEGNPQDPAST